MKKLKLVIYSVLILILPLKLFAGEYGTQLLNGMDKNMFYVFLTFGYIGMLLNILSDVFRRTPASTTSPERFILSYWWNDNKQRLIMSIIIIPIAIIFFNELIGVEITKFNSLFLGLSSDHFIEILKRKNIIKSES